jgi:hypothetical protein
VLAFVVSVSLKSILGAFGFAIESVETLSQLRTSQNIAQTMKARHKNKKANASKKFLKKAGKRVTSSAVAAATLGTAAVTVIVIGLEVEDYCEDKKELLAEENILFGSDETFDYKKCLSDAEKESEKILTEVKDSVSNSVQESWESTSNYTQEQWDELLVDIDRTMTKFLKSLAKWFESLKSLFD